MNYEQLQLAVMDAYRQDPAQCIALMDQFIDTAQGSDLGHALCLKASFLMRHDQLRCAEGLGLVEDALTVAEGHPGLLMKCVVDGLGLCYTMGDPHRARRYDLLGHQILKEHGADPAVQLMTYRMYLNLAHIATLRQEPTQAYWHLVQGTQALLSLDEETPGAKSFRFLFYLRTAEICIEMGRNPEAEDALAKAKGCVSSTADDLTWQIYWATYLQANHHQDSAAELLDELADAVLADRRPSVQVVFHLTSSLVAQTRGEVRKFHHHLAKAQDIAVTYALDFMLCRIQRVMRTPVRLEAAK
ncbi:MAG: hypothetical protein K0R39_4143 [Symbiobacteriaceae bacterium]|jgi:hypothetical protein|nr:hypothetical protein [Symbiobacteriaceae bacterium]